MSDVAPTIDALFAEWDNSNSPGAAIAIIQRGAVIYQQGYGMANIELGVPITPKTVFPVASIAKQFTAAAIALLMLEGALTPDDDSRQYIPELPDYGTPITINHLVHHHSGIRDWARLARLSGRGDDLWTMDRVLALLTRQQGLNFIPGTKFAYSNSGYVLLALIVARITGQSLRAFCQENVFGPLGMNHTVFRDDHQMLIMNRAASYRRGADGGLQSITVHADVVGDFNLYTTIEDLSRWDQNFYDNQLAAGNPAFLDIMHRSRPLSEGAAQHYAFGLVLDSYRGLNSVQHGGGNAACQAQMWRFPEQQLTVICLSNSGDFKPNPIVLTVADLLLVDELAAPVSAPPTINVSSGLLATKTGQYRARDNPSIFGVILEADQLFLVLHESLRIPLVPVSDTLFWRDDRAEIIMLAVDSQAPIDPRADQVFDRLEIPQLTVDDLEAYVGDYTSSELATTYRLTMLDGGLVVQHPDLPGVHLRPIAADQFSGSGLEWHFGRKQGIVAGFTLVDDRAAGVYFTR